MGRCHSCPHTAYGRINGSGKETEHLQRKQLLVGPRLRHRRDTNIPAVTIQSRIWTLLVP
jgi:hypothetical protein